MIEVERPERDEVYVYKDRNMKLGNPWLTLIGRCISS